MIRLFTALFVLLFSISSIAQTGESTAAASSAAEQARHNYGQERQLQWISKAISLLPWALGIVVSQQLQDRKNGFLKAVGSLGSVIFSAQMISQILSKPLTTNINWFSMKVASSMMGVDTQESSNPIDAIFVELETLRIEYQNLKDKLSPDTQILFEKLESSLLSAKSQNAFMINQGADQTTNDVLKKQLSKIADLMRVLLSLAESPNPLDLDKIKTNLKPILDRYDAGLQEDIKALTVAIVRSSKLEHGTKTVLYLLGEPGTGKTTFVKLYAPSLDLNFINIGDIETALKINNQPLFLHGDTINEAFTLSLFTESITKRLPNQKKAGAKKLIFLDEIDKFFAANPNHMDRSRAIIESFLLQLLDPNQAMVKLPDLGIDIDTSDWVIVAAGNKLFNAPFMSRMTQWIFPCIDPAMRPQIAQKRFEIEMAKRPDLQRSEKDIEIIETIAAQDRCGVRGMEFVVDDYVNWKDLKQSDWGIGGEFNVEAQFAKHPEAAKVKAVDS